MNETEIKKDFPIFKAQSRDGAPFTFLDSAATSQMPQVVIDSMLEFYSTYKANVHSGIYSIGVRAVEAYEGARRKVAMFLGAHSNEVIFTSGTTASLNMLARMLEVRISAGDEIMVSAMEHHSNFIPWQELAKRTGAVFTVLPLEKDGTLSAGTIRAMAGPRTKIIAVTHVSHATGSVNDVREISSIARGVGAFFVLDAAQSAPHMPIDVQKIDCDFLAFSGQKMLGPTGIGILYGKEKHLREIAPAVFGGGMIREVRTDSSTWADMPQKFEAGTPHVAGAIGLGAAISYIEVIGRAELMAHERNLADMARCALTNMPGIHVYGPHNEHETAGIVSFTVEGMHAHDVAEILSRENIAVRAGHHCALPLMNHFGISGTIRASFYLYNTEKDVERLLTGVKKAQGIFHA
ncbi:MAG: cysteine desulfurase [Candidatus Ryanbacteria bacterium RIFCSPHIGHO2_02_FULL_45_17b]|uniref:Cysteine desulfurase n=1 Tax=Candidatus Ryanbacteria bacterium RIFCSPHIGHO2_01_FULL_45_22 TaxID=1802114 RepID=A0A1G2G1X4_9BACT|nr:MAG: cysteine desulfurase [Candidatus Ryanbacteria bacterium RIFCSPHIGHO2_01_FULL_45_22]OGZ47116.1 MAG: cysteine desulfurase [Candidatus Ryanbacteria bacterium RIFCSPHIGHO2_02_FULL_45_17b]